MARLINIDNGGTLTDIWVLDGKSSYHTKTITTPYDLSKCFFEGLKKVSRLIYGDEDLAALLQGTDHIRYSTTQGTNALVMKQGPKIGLVLGAETKLESIVSGAQEKEMFEALVGDRVERLDSNLTDEAYRQALLNAVNKLSFRGANRIVVSFDGADYLEQEARFRRANLSVFPSHLLGAVPVLYAGNLSSDTDFGRRTWTAVNNAFLHPAMERFLFNAENKLREHRCTNPLLIYRNDGYAGRVAKTVALKTYSSGPRAGMDSAKEYADYYEFKRCLTMDVGGTTTDIGLVENGAVKTLSQGEVEGIACSFSLSDIRSIGIGGGSIIRVQDGQITVGPDSVGGMPGPVCFGLGGKNPTITDALLLLGLIDPATYFGGEMDLDAERAKDVIEEKIAKPLSMTVEEAVHQMLDCWAKSIAKGLHEYTSIDGDTVLAAYGGGGPLASLAIAEAAGISRVLVPRLSAVFSAHGIGFSGIAHMADLQLKENNQAELESQFQSVQEKVKRDIFSEGFEISECECEAWLSVNGEHTPVDPNHPLLPDSVTGEDEVKVGLKALKSVEKAQLPKRVDHAESPVKVSGYRQLIHADGSVEKIPVIRTEDQKPGASGVGAAVIEEAFWTCMVDAGWHFRFTANGDVLFENEAKKNK